MPPAVPPQPGAAAPPFSAPPPECAPVPAVLFKEASGPGFCKAQEIILTSNSQGFSLWSSKMSKPRISKQAQVPPLRYWGKQVR